MDAEDVILYDLLFCIQRRKHHKEEPNMTAITMLCTLCGAAALSRGVLRLLDAIDGEKR